MTTKKQPIDFDHLDRIYNAYEDVEDKSFYVGVADYVKYIFESSSFENIIEKIKNTYSENDFEQTEIYFWNKLFDVYKAVYLQPEDIYKVEDMTPNKLEDYLRKQEMNKILGKDYYGQVKSEFFRNQKYQEIRDGLKKIHLHLNKTKDVISDSGVETKTNDKCVIYTSEKLQLNKSKGILSYGKELIHVNTTSKDIKFLVMLFEKGGNILGYLEIVNELELTGSQNEETSLIVQRTVRKDLAKTLKRLGISGQKIKKIIINVRKEGYKII
jgi:hypothetical protein